MLILLGFGGMLLLGAVLWIFLTPPTPQPPVPKPEDPKIAAGTNSAPTVPPTPPFRANLTSKSGSTAASQPSPLDKKAEVKKPEKPPEKKDPDEEAVTMRFPNPLPTSAPLLSDKSFATVTGAKGKLPPPDAGTPLQQRIPKKLVRTALVAPLSSFGATGGELTLGLKSLSREEALIEIGAVDALEAVYAEGDPTVGESLQTIRIIVRPPPGPRVPMPRPPPAPRTPPAPEPPPKAPSLLPAWARTSPKTSGFGLIRYRLLAMDEVAKAEAVLAQWLSRYSFANSRTERIQRTDKREIKLIIFDPSSATMGFTVMFWINGNVVNQIASYGNVGAKDLFLLLPY